MKKFCKYATLLAAVLFIAVGFTSCGDDDDDNSTSNNSSIVGLWQMSETYGDDYETKSVTMDLTFNSNHTGRIVENWTSESRASSKEVYTMDFEWATTTDSSGNDIIKVSYVSGDKVTELFPGGSSTVLWSRQYVLTGKTLNIYGGDGVWVFKKK